MNTRRQALKPIFLLCLAGLTGLANAGAPGEGPGRSIMLKAAPGILKAERPIAGEYIVVFKRSAVKPSALPGRESVAIATANLAATLSARYQVGVTTTWAHALQGMAITARPAQAAALARDPRVASVEENGEVHLDATQTGAPWGLDRIDQRNLPLDTWFNYSTTATNVTAYIIDTGIRTTHGQFGGRASSGYDAFGGTGQDCNGHGTHVAGTVGGSAYGVAKDVKLRAVRVLNCSGSGTWNGVISGINWVTANKQLPAVANMSLGGGYSAAVNQAVAGSITAGVSYAVAAGNGDSSGNPVNACNVSPASTPNALTVGATSSTDTRANWSNIGTCLDLFAPGVSILSAWYTSDTASNTISGTSMATPHVAGAAALYLAGNPSATPAQVASALTTAATPNLVVSPGTGSPNRLLYTGNAPLDTILPTVNLTAPTTGQILSGTGVNLSATASDNQGVARVEFQVGGNLVGTDTTAPYAIAWDSTNFVNGTYAFTAKAVDMAGNSKTSASVNATVSNTGACSTTQQLVLNPGFESGQSNWISTTGVIASIPGNTRTGNYAAWLNGYGATSTDTLYQTVAIPATACAATYTFWLKITTAETTTTIAYDKLTVAVQNSAGTTLGTLASYSNLNKTGDYVQRSFNLLPYKGQTIRLHFRGVEDSSLATNFLIDDVALNIRK